MEDLQASGRYTFTATEAVRATGGTATGVYQAARRLASSGKLAKLRSGFYAIVPPEHRAAGSTPAAWFVDDLMAFHGRPYYVGLLTAAGLHGASHQAAMEFQVLTDSPLRSLEAGRVRVRFFQSHSVSAVPVVRVNTPTGTMAVSTPEATALDLVRYRRRVGGLSQVATVLAELAEQIDPHLLPRVAEHMEISVAQRTGYLLEQVADEALVEPLARWLETTKVFPVPLRPDLPRSDAERNERWCVIVNDIVEPDL